MLKLLFVSGLWCNTCFKYLFYKNVFINTLYNTKKMFNFIWRLWISCHYLLVKRFLKEEYCNVS